MTISVGDRLPDATFMVAGDNGPVRMSTGDLFAGRTVVLFGVPGAFTPTCHRNHLPGFLEHNAALRDAGVDEIAVVAVNDAHVMAAWAEASGARGKILFLADGNADFVRALGLESDRSAGGMGLRSKRFSMVVEDGVVQVLNVEDAPGEVTKSGAAGILEFLNVRAASRPG